MEIINRFGERIMIRDVIKQKMVNRWMYDNSMRRVDDVERCVWGW